MKELRINEKISYIEASENPLSADIGIIRENGETWLFDVGNGENSLAGLTNCDHVVLSHFHPDHTGNIGKIKAREIYASKVTCDHIHQGTVVTEPLRIGGLHIFPLPSSHAGGCLGLEIDDTYAFVGDALYCRVKNGCLVYNAQLLQQEITVLKSLRAPDLLVSHRPGLLRAREEVIAELEAIYRRRDKNRSEIILPMTEET